MAKRKIYKAEWEHLCVLIFAQNTWKGKDYKKLEAKAVSEFIGNAGHEDCDLCLTCPICRATWELFDPKNLGEFNFICKYCEVLIPFFESYQTGDNVLLFSHQNLNIEGLRSFIELNLTNDKVKKIFILQLQEWEKKVKMPKAEDLIGLIIHKKLKRSEFIALLDSEEFEYRVLYDVFKDAYY